MSNISKTGLVAFFDILGYSAFIENNEPEDAAKSINNFISKVEDFTNSKFVDFFQEDKKSKINSVVKKIEPLIISDSILITLECDKESESYRYELGVFLLYCSIFTEDLFVFGLPLRGCIEYGEFYTAKNTFAGKPIIKAYKASGEIEMSGCLVSETVSLDKITKQVKNKLYFNYLVPTKNGDKELTLLKFTLGLEDKESTLCDNDPKQFVVNSFSAHNKLISSSVYEKINNTEMFIRYCKAVDPGAIKVIKKTVKKIQKKIKKI